MTVDNELQAPDPPFQFSLWQLFALVTLAAMSMVVARILGDFLGALIVGAVIIWVCVDACGIENILAGGFAGVALGMCVFAVAAIASPGFSADLGLLFVIYVPLGYALGVLAATDRALRSG